MIQPTFTLVVGSKNYSSWSLRPYLALAHTGQPFQ
ncbi:MAG TPA: glutathione S-transferase, partial [Aggregicoccus sp.]|nr:glutathione S-transferase [Aggregicoccus sp.]